MRIQVFIWTENKNSLTNEEYNTSYITDLKDEHHDIYEMKKINHQYDCLLNSKYNLRICSKVTKIRRRKFLLSVKFRVGQTANPYQDQKETNLR